MSGRLSAAHIEAEASLLGAVAANDGQAVRDSLTRGVACADLLCLEVKSSFHNARDRTAFYHSVASYGLKYELGDTVEKLAFRNELTEAAQALHDASKSEAAVLADKRRVAAEADLLAALAEDDASGVRRALAQHVAPANLLCLQVKGTFNNLRDRSAFFHSIASFGLQCELGDNSYQLAMRNSLGEVAQVLQEAMTEASGTLGERRTSAEAALLAAIAADDGAGVRRALIETVPPHDLLQLQVKSTLGDVGDKSAFFHPIASYGLRYELGDNAQKLAARNSRTRATVSLNRFLRRCAVPKVSDRRDETQQHVPETAESSAFTIHVSVSAVSGDVVAELDCASTWTVDMLYRSIGEVIPPADGCLLLLLGEAPLNVRACLADLHNDGDGGILLLTSIIVPDVAGAYTARVERCENTLDLPGVENGLRPLRRQPITLNLELSQGGSVSFLSTERPFDRGHCAPPSGGCKLRATGTWRFEGTGVLVLLEDGETSRMVRGRWDREEPVNLGQRVVLTMAHKSQLAVAQVEGPPQERAACRIGTVFLRQERNPEPPA